MARRPYTQSARFEMRCTPEELEVWRRIASEHGLSLAACIRMLLSKYDSKLSKFIPNYQKLPNFNRKDSKLIKVQASPDLLRQIAAIGNNLNQIAYWCNTYKSNQDTILVEKEVENVRKALERLLIPEDTL